MRVSKEEINVMIAAIRAVKLEEKFPNEFDIAVGGTFVKIAANGAKLITNVHELVQFQKVLNMSIDENPLIMDKTITKEIVEEELYKKED